jgi:hypothetical protein
MQIFIASTKNNNNNNNNKKPSRRRKCVALSTFHSKDRKSVVSRHKHMGSQAMPCCSSYDTYWFAQSSVLLGIPTFPPQPTHTDQ